MATLAMNVGGGWGDVDELHDDLFERQHGADGEV